MKKGYALLFVIPIVLMTLWGCQSVSHGAAPSNGAPKSSVPLRSKPSPYKSTLLDHYQDADYNVKLTLRQEASTDLSLVITNSGKKGVGCGVKYTVEKWVNRQWYSLPFKPNVAFIELAVLLLPGKTYDQKVDFQLLDEKLAPGKYRVVKTLSPHIVLAKPFAINKEGMIDVSD